MKQITYLCPTKELSNNSYWLLDNGMGDLEVEYNRFIFIKGHPMETNVTLYVTDEQATLISLKYVVFLIRNI